MYLKLSDYMYFMKETKLQIRCNESTIWRFKVFVAQSNSKNYEEALNRLLDLANVPRKDIKSI